MNSLRSIRMATVVSAAVAFAAIAAESAQPEIQREDDLWSVVVDGVDVNLWITAQLKDGVDARSVSFYDGGVLLGRVSGKPYAFEWRNVPAGSHAVIAIADLLKEDDLRSSSVLWVVGVPKSGR